MFSRRKVVLRSQLCCLWTTNSTKKTSWSFLTSWMYKTHPRISRSREDNFLKISLWKSGRRVSRPRYMPRTTTHERKGAYDQANKVVRVFVLLLVSKALCCWSPFCRMIDQHSPELWTKSTAVLTLCSRNFWDEVTTSMSSLVGTLRCKKQFCDFQVSEVKPANKTHGKRRTFHGHAFDGE